MNRRPILIGSAIAIVAVLATVLLAPHERGNLLYQIFYSGPSLDTLHSDYAKHGRLDDNALVLSRESIVIHAPAARVWQLLAAPEQWHAWSTDIRDVHLSDGVKEDATLTWKKGAAARRNGSTS